MYQPIIEPVLQAVSQANVLLILDTTDVGLDCHLLTVAVGYQRRALPVV